MRRWTMAAAALAVAAALSSGSAPWLHALGGAFVPPDFAQDLAAARVTFAGQDPYRVGIAEEHARLMGGPAAVDYRFFPHPPLVVGLSAPLAHLELRQAALIWFVVSLIFLLAFAVVLADTIADVPDVNSRQRASKTMVFLVFAALIAWPPVLYNLEKGQWSILVALLLALAWRFGRELRPREAGACVGVAAGLKLFPLLLVPYLFLRMPRAVVSTAAVVLAVFILPLAVMGPATAGAFFDQSRANVAYWETWPAVTYSVHGAFVRALVGGQWARPFLHNPTVARMLEALVVILLLAVAVMVTGRHRGDPTREGVRYAAWMALLVALNPVSMGHNGVILALPIVLIALALANDRRIWPKVVWLAGIVLVSLPRQLLMPTLPVTTNPWEGIVVIALPLWGTLLLFAVAVTVASPLSASFSRWPRQTVGLRRRSEPSAPSW